MEAVNRSYAREMNERFGYLAVRRFVFGYKRAREAQGRPLAAFCPGRQGAASSAEASRRPPGANEKGAAKRRPRPFKRKGASVVAWSTAKRDVTKSQRIV